MGNGCPNVQMQTIPSRPQLAAVRCCSMAGDNCVTPDECFKNATFDQAQEKCAAIGRRLCTPAELNDNRCCGTGCEFDVELTWQKSLGNLFGLVVKQDLNLD